MCMVWLCAPTLVWLTVQPYLASINRVNHNEYQPFKGSLKGKKWFVCVLSMPTSTFNEMCVYAREAGGGVGGL